jgi:hypothetical protein
MPRSQHTFPPFGRLPPRSELATSCWKAPCRLVLAVHDDEGSPVTGCGQTWCLRRGETTPLLPGVQVSCLGQPRIGPACRLFPPSVQILPIVGPRGSACGVPMRPAGYRGPSASPPCTCRHGAGKRQARKGRWAGGDHTHPQALSAFRKLSCLCQRKRTWTVTLLDMKHHATDRFRRDPICGCHDAKRFLLLHHTLHHGRPF